MAVRESATADLLGTNYGFSVQLFGRKRLVVVCASGNVVPRRCWAWTRPAVIATRCPVPQRSARWALRPVVHGRRKDRIVTATEAA
jgi:hypothetical protein